MKAVQYEMSAIGVGGAGVVVAAVLAAAARRLHDEARRRRPHEAFEADRALFVDSAEEDAALVRRLKALEDADYPLQAARDELATRREERAAISGARSGLLKQMVVAAAAQAVSGPGELER